MWGRGGNLRLNLVLLVLSYKPNSLNMLCGRRSRRHNNYNDNDTIGHRSSARNNEYGVGSDTGPAYHKRHNGGLFHRRNPDKVAGGYRAALTNPNTTRDGRENARHELHSMGYSAHVPLMTKIKRTLGIRSSPRRDRNRTRADLY